MSASTPVATDRSMCQAPMVPPNKGIIEVQHDIKSGFKPTSYMTAPWSLCQLGRMGGAVFLLCYFVVRILQAWLDQ